MIHAHAEVERNIKSVAERMHRKEYENISRHSDMLCLEL